MEIALILVGPTWVERQDPCFTTGTYARPKVYQRQGKAGLWRLEIPHGDLTLMTDDMLKPIVQDKRRIPAFRKAIDEALRSTIGTVVPLAIPTPTRTPVAPSVPKPPKPAKVVKPKPPKPPKHSVGNGKKVCTVCGVNKPLSDFYRNGNHPHGPCKPCFGKKYKKRSPTATASGLRT